MAGRSWRSTVVAALGVLALAAPAAAQTSRGDAIAAQQAQILASVGGAYSGPQSAYVSKIGERMATAAGLPGQCVFTIVNSEVVNAFTAPPGCYVYVTRGLLALMNSEAELAAVLGHELGHVRANHARRQQNAEAVSSIAAVLVGAVAKSDQVGQIAGRVAKLGTLSYSRNQEYEADSLALKYLPLAGYAPEGLSRVLDGLQREDAFSARAGGAPGGGVPVWARTHPLTSDRIRRAATQATGPVPQGLVLNEAAYLSAVDGLPYGDDPSQGVIRGRTFAHPVLRIAFETPAGFQIENGREAVRLSRPDGLVGEFSAGALNDDLEQYAYGVLRRVVGQARVGLDEPRRTRINGLDAIIVRAHATSQGRPVDLTVAAYAIGDRAYHFVTLAPPAQSAIFDPLYASFRRLTDREAAQVAFRRIQVTPVRDGDTVESLAGRMVTGDDRVGRFLMLNALSPDRPPGPGRRVKLVTDGR